MSTFLDDIYATREVTIADALSFDIVELGLALVLSARDGTNSRSIHFEVDSAHSSFTRGVAGNHTCRMLAHRQSVKVVLRVIGVGHQFSVEIHLVGTSSDGMCLTLFLGK